MDSLGRPMLITASVAGMSCEECDNRHNTRYAGGIHGLLLSVSMGMAKTSHILAEMAESTNRQRNSSWPWRIAGTWSLHSGRWQCETPFHLRVPEGATAPEKSHWWTCPHANTPSKTEQPAWSTKVVVSSFFVSPARPKGAPFRCWCLYWCFVLHQQSYHSKATGCRRAVNSRDWQ